MYRINRLSRPVLITIDEVIAKAVVDENPDVRYLMNSIEVAEERFIASALGNAFYEDFIAAKNVTVTNVNQAALVASINASLTAAGENMITSASLPVGFLVNAIELCPTEYQALWNRFLWKIVAEAVDIMAIIPSWTRTTASGQQQNNPKSITSDGTGTATADRKDVQYKVDSMVQQRLNPLIDRMKKWICDQPEGTYPLFDCGCSTDKSGINTQLKGGIIFGIYDERDKLDRRNGRNQRGYGSDGLGFSDKDGLIW